MKSNKLAWLLIASLGIALISSAPSAQTPEDKETARVLFGDGMVLRDEQKKPADAEKKIEQAWKLLQTPIIGLELGRTKMQLGHLIEARELFANVGKMPVKPNESKATRDARDEAAKMIDAVSARIAGVTITVNHAPESGFSIKVDGVDFNLAALGVSRKMDPGAHTIVFEQPNRAPQTLSLDLKDAENRAVSFDYDVTAASAPSASAAPSAQPAPTASASASTTTSPSTASSSQGAPFPVAGVVVGGVGVLSLAAAGVFALLGNSDWSNANKTCQSSSQSCDATGRSWQQKAVSMADATTVTLIAGGVLLAAGVGIVVFTSHSSESSPKTSLLVTPGGLSVVGRF